MPAPRPIPLDIPPGVIKTEANRAMEGRYIDSQWVRFRNGKPEKRGGFTLQPRAQASGVPLLTRTELKQRERESITVALAQTHGKVFGRDGAAALLGMKPTTLASRIKALGLQRK